MLVLSAGAGAGAGAECVCGCEYVQYLGTSVMKMFGSNHPESDNTVTPLFSLSFSHSHRVLFVHTYVRTYVSMRVSVFVDVSKGRRV